MVHALRKPVIYILIASLLSLGSPALVQAEIIGTLAGLESAQRSSDLAKLSSVLARDEAREKMRALGVDETQLEARLAGLTDSELRGLAERVDELPAGAGVVEVVGIVFIVLLILEAVGVIDIFKKFP
ncbi:MAG TPA: PA2779 family protein [Steroidobacter sp.]|jgi:hypothetical protein|nr:PA2779 family protein [Steroidobacteraceae bacterium]HLS82141.1 PA2779 family protein [Steroidobacter sp.]